MIFQKGIDPRRVAGGDMDEWLTDILEGEEGGKDKKIQKRPYLYGSDAGFCARRNVLLGENVWIESTVNSAGKGYMAIGVAFEDILVQALKRKRHFLAGQLRGVELAELKISSKFDAIILDAQDNLALLEVKTCGQFPDEEKPAHLAQIQMYAAISGIRNAHLVYMSRDLSPLRSIPIRTFRVDTSDDALLQRLQIAEESAEAAKRRVLPPVPATFRKHTECHYCEFRDYFCWGARPSRGGDPAAPPLRELTPAEYIELATSARGRAEAHLQGMDVRYLETIRSILREGEITLFTKQRKRLKALASEAEVRVEGV